MPALGRILVVAGVVLVLLGFLVLVAGRLNLPIGRLPGDITWRGRHSTFYFPVVTCLLASVLLSLLLWLIQRRP